MGQHATIHGKTTEDFNGQDGKWIPIRVSANGIVNVYETAPAGYNQQQMAVTTVNHGNWFTVAVSQTDAALGATGGAAGDYLESLTITVATAASAAVSIKDGAGSAVSILPNSPGGGIGVYPVALGMASKTGAWKITTGAGVTVIAHGRFS